MTWLGCWVISVAHRVIIYSGSPVQLLYALTSLNSEAFTNVSPLVCRAEVQ